jgi:hypothetical protein
MLGACSLAALLVRGARRRPRTELFGCAAGVGSLMIWIAVLNRHGPGQYCVTSHGGSHCEDFWNPWPWAVVGFILIAVAIVGGSGLGFPKQR